MAAILTNLRNTVIAGFVLTAIMAIVVTGLTGDTFAMDMSYYAFLVRWAHVISGVMWIGLLWYLNFIQVPSMPKIPDDQKPAIGKVIAPAVLFWFRWAAMSTIAFGLWLATLNGYVMEALTIGAMDGFDTPKFTAIGIGMWFGIIMWFNVWFIIWPNQKKVLGMVEADADTKAAAAKTALYASRTNTMLSFPMLFAMVAAQNIY